MDTAKWDEFIEIVKKSLAEECPITLDHAKVHLDSAIEARTIVDMEQLAHDAHIAGSILLVLAARLNKEITKDLDGL